MHVADTLWLPQMSSKVLWWCRHAPLICVRLHMSSKLTEPSSGSWKMKKTPKWIKLNILLYFSNEWYTRSFKSWEGEHLSLHVSNHKEIFSIFTNFGKKGGISVSLGLYIETYRTGLILKSTSHAMCLIEVQHFWKFVLFILYIQFWAESILLVYKEERLMEWSMKCVVAIGSKPDILVVH